MLFLSVSCLILQALWLHDIEGRRFHRASPSFVHPNVLLYSLPVECKSNSHRGSRTSATGKFRLMDSTTPALVKQFHPWEIRLQETWKKHGDSILLGAVYGIRIFRFILHLRNLLEWLPQANPYLFPFDAVYQTTTTYLKLFQAVVPSLYGVDVSGLVAIFVLDHIEALLAHKPGVAQEALK